MAKTNKYENTSIKDMDLDKDTLKILNDNNINTIGELWILKRTTLKTFGLKDKEIKDIVIKLQLLGLDLNKKIYC